MADLGQHQHSFLACRFADVDEDGAPEIGPLGFLDIEGDGRRDVLFSDDRAGAQPVVE